MPHNIDQKDVEHIAGLARIKLGSKEKDHLAKEISDILTYINKLNEVKTDGIEPIAHITGLENVAREDKPSEKLLEEQATIGKKLVEMAPDKKDNFVKVRAVFGDL